MSHMLRRLKFRPAGEIDDDHSGALSYLLAKGLWPWHICKTHCFSWFGGSRAHFAEASAQELREGPARRVLHNQEQAMGSEH
jgi:hypothetical protein